jgi:hypothetical protein
MDDGSGGQSGIARHGLVRHRPAMHLPIPPVLTSVKQPKHQLLLLVLDYTMHYNYKTVHICMSGVEKLKFNICVMHILDSRSRTVYHMQHY